VSTTRHDAARNLARQLPVRQLLGNGINTNFHLMAFPAAGCGAATCKPARTYDTVPG
jgi:hypothetical protein